MDAGYFYVPYPELTGDINYANLPKAKPRLVGSERKRLMRQERKLRKKARKDHLKNSRYQIQVALNYGWLMEKSQIDMLETVRTAVEQLKQAPKEDLVEENQAIIELYQARAVDYCTGVIDWHVKEGFNNIWDLVRYIEKAVYVNPRNYETLSYITLLEEGRMRVWDRTEQMDVSESVKEKLWHPRTDDE